LDFTAPIIIVGAGRSGTTLLEGVLQAHADIYSIGETAFLLHRMHAALVEKADYYISGYAHLAHSRDPEWTKLSFLNYMSSRVTRGDWHSIGPLFEQAIEEERLRRARELGATFGRLMIPPDLRGERWLFREIWMGGEAFPHKLDLFYDAFPNAVYLQSIRHPIGYMRSGANNLRQMVDRDQARHWLQNWLSMVRYNREAGARRPYFEFRYEDLVSNGPATLDRIFGFLGLAVQPRCLEALAFRFVPSEGPRHFEGEEEALLASVPGVAEEMQRLGYDWPSASPDPRDGPRPPVQIGVDRARPEPAWSGTSLDTLQQ